MIEYDNVKDALKDILELLNASDFRNGETNQPFLVKDFQELLKEPIMNVADLLGLSDLYLNDGQIEQIKEEH